jgi:sterol desaturase/sphingolipid hydroxylase (fatty acid hydroxylase superfamily)
VDRLIDLVLHAVRRWWEGPQLFNLCAVAVLVGIMVVAERVRFGTAQRYVSSNVRTDALYAVFYLGGFFALLVGTTVFRAARLLLQSVVPGVPFNLLSGLPPLVQYPVFFLVGDMIDYWTHRWSHANRVLWAFHSVHHSQDVLTVLTSFRSHFADMIVRVGGSFVAGLVLGATPETWLIVTLLALWHSAVTHSGLDWSFGPLARLVVSPRHHGIHHSTRPEHHGRNFGVVFSLWDYLFGTAESRARLPQPYGLPGPRMPESFFRQLAVPFLTLARARGTTTAAARG